MSRLLKRQRGFTLIELLIVIAIIGIIAAILIPNFLDSLQKAKQKRTMGDIKDTGTAWFAWLTDQFGGAAAAGATYAMPDTYAGNVGTDLEPQGDFGGYIQEVRTKDAWDNDLHFCRVVDAELLTADEVMGIISWGRNDATDSAACGDDITVGAFDPTDYDEDIAWADGYFIRYPQKVAGGGGGT